MNKIKLDDKSKEYAEALARNAYDVDLVWAAVEAGIPLEDITQDIYMGMYKSAWEFAYMYAGENGMLEGLHETVKSCIDWYMYWDTYLAKDYVYADSRVFKKVEEKR